MTDNYTCRCGEICGITLLKFLLTALVCLLATGVNADSRCREKKPGFFVPGEITCSYNSLMVASSNITAREVQYQLPLGTPPVDGWPVVIVYQGSFFPVEFHRTSLTPFGGYHELKTIKTLLDNGYAVLAPRAPAEIAWLTNSAGPATIYEITTDYTFLNNVFQAIREGIFGPLNAQRKYAVGISSGGYNTSRMAVTWPTEFKALVIQSGSYATCAGPVCLVPSHLSAKHPPTKFIHGFLDPIVPWYTMNDYYDALLFHGIDTAVVTEPLGGHAWFKDSPREVLRWFNRYP